MKLAVITCCLYPSLDRIHYLIDSCKRHDIDIIPHGLGQGFYGWAEAFRHHTIPSIQHLLAADYTHVLYVDGNDCIFTSGVEEIIEKYFEYGAPQCLMAAETNLYPDLGLEVADRFAKTVNPWRFLNAGTYIAEIPYFYNLCSRLKDIKTDGNHQEWFVSEWPIDGMKLDTECKIFQTMDYVPPLEVKNGRVVNTLTGSNPCVLHFLGGYSDPKNGRDDRMKPWIERLYE